MHKMFLSALMTLSMNAFASDAILVNSCEALQAIPDLSAHYKLVGDQIDCSGIDFQPIGTIDQPFIGELNGNGVPLIGLTINKVNSDYVGLFGVIGANAVIKNMVIEQAVVQGQQCVGILTGASNAYPLSASLMNNTVSGSVAGFALVGGLIGVASDLILTESYSEANVTAYSIAGGLVGVSDKSKISNAYATGSVSGESEPGDRGAYALGGLVGILEDSSIMNAYATGSVSGEGAMGGLVGIISRLNAFDRSSIVNAYATGRVTSTVNNVRSGGLVGTMNPGNMDNKLVEHSFWDLQTTGQVNSDGGGLGVNTSVLQDQAIFDANGWDFETVWAPMTSSQYPQFQYQVR